MACLYPLKLGVKDRNGRELKVDCGRCLSCLIKKTKYLEFIAKKEALETYRKKQGIAFITLTYTDENLWMSVPKNKNLKKYTEIIKDRKPRKDFIKVKIKDYLNNETALEWIVQNGVNTLNRKDLTNYIKRIRAEMQRNNDRKEIKILYCGEYGNDNYRSHYHLIIFGLSKEEATMYSKGAWKEGMQEIGALGQGGIRYLIDYINKSQDYKLRNELYEKRGVEKPFIYHSINFGKKWIDENSDELVKNDFTYWVKGEKRLIPTQVIKYICCKKGLNEKAFYSKLFRQIDNDTREKRGEKSVEQYLFDEKQKKEESIYTEIRQKGEKSISPEYKVQIAQAERPKTTRIWTKDTCKNSAYKELLRRQKISDAKENKRVKKANTTLLPDDIF